MTQVALRPNFRHEVKFGLKFRVRPNFCLRLSALSLVLAKLDVTSVSDSYEHVLRVEMALFMS